MVYVIQPSTNGDGGLVAYQRVVKTGRAQGDFVSVVSGLKAGDRVVRSGLFKLHNGGSVEVNDEIVPPAELTPRPSNS